MQNQQKTISSHGQVKCFWIKHKLDHKSGLGKFKIIKIYQDFFNQNITCHLWVGEQNENKQTHKHKKQRTN